MTDRTGAQAVLARLIAELDGLLTQVQQDINAVRGKERLRRWKAAAVTTLAQQVGPEAAGRLAAAVPGLSFSQDLHEELSDEAEVYRETLQGIVRSLSGRPG